MPRLNTDNLGQVSHRSTTNLDRPLTGPAESCPWAWRSRSVLGANFSISDGLQKLGAHPRVLSVSSSDSLRSTTREPTHWIFIDRSDYPLRRYRGWRQLSRQIPDGLPPGYTDLLFALRPGRDLHLMSHIRVLGSPSYAGRRRAVCFFHNPSPHTSREHRPWRFRQRIRLVDWARHPVYISSYLPHLPAPHKLAQGSLICLYQVLQSYDDSITSTDLRQIFAINFTMYYTNKSMPSTRKALNRMIWRGLLTLWTKYVTMSPFSALYSSRVGSLPSRSFHPSFPQVPT